MQTFLRERIDEITLAAVSALAFFVFAFIQFATPNLLGTDGYYHLKLATLLRDTPLLQWPMDFPWLPETVLSSERYVDHHFLYHVFLIPFVLLSEITGAKWGAVVAATLVFVAFQLALPRAGWRSRIFWSLVMLSVSPGFLYRMSMVRAQSLSLVMLLLLFIALRHERHRTVAALSFVYVWLYNAFPLVAILVGSFFVCQFLTKRTLNIPLLGWAALGLFAGILINPYFPENVFFLYHHLIDKFQPGGYAVKVGSEWYAYSSKNFLTHAALPLVCFSVALWLAPAREESESRSVWALLLFTTVLLVMLLKSRRFIELFPLFAVLSAAWSVSLTNLPKLQLGVVRSTLALAALGTISLFSAQTAADSARDSKNFETYRETAEWLNENTEKGTLIFTADWDDFPRLFYWNSHNTYLAGLDPYFLYSTDPARFHLWRRLTQGKTKAPPGQIIRSRFNTRYVFIDKKHERFRKQLEKDKNVQLAFKSGDSYVYEISPES